MAVSGLESSQLGFSRHARPRAQELHGRKGFIGIRSGRLANATPCKGPAGVRCPILPGPRAAIGRTSIDVGMLEAES